MQSFLGDEGDQIGMKVTYQNGKVWIHRGSELAVWETVSSGFLYGQARRE